MIPPISIVCDGGLFFLLSALVCVVCVVYMVCAALWWFRGRMFFVYLCCAVLCFRITIYVLFYRDYHI